MYLFAVVILDISTKNFAKELSERNLTSCETLPCTSDLLEINVTNLNSFETS